MGFNQSWPSEEDCQCEVVTLVWVFNWFRNFPAQQACIWWNLASSRNVTGHWVVYYLQLLVKLDKWFLHRQHSSFWKYGFPRKFWVSWFKGTIPQTPEHRLCCHILLVRRYLEFAGQLTLGHLIQVIINGSWGQLQHLSLNIQLLHHLNKHDASVLYVPLTL